MYSLYPQNCSWPLKSGTMLLPPAMNAFCVRVDMFLSGFRCSHMYVYTRVFAPKKHMRYNKCKCLFPKDYCVHDPARPNTGRFTEPDVWA